MKRTLPILLMLITWASAGDLLFSQTHPSNDSDHLVILWTTGDQEVAKTSCLMYGHAAMKYGWFREVTLIIWGPSARLVASDREIIDKLLAMKADGVRLEACVACSNMLEVTDDLEALGIDVRGMGAQLSQYLKSGAHVLTY